jgi:hypothetical protein
VVRNNGNRATSPWKRREREVTMKDETRTINKNNLS